MSSVDYTRINAIGASVISALTLIASVYLLYCLIGQGRGKLRVRLLLGLVSSDMLLGIVVIPPELGYVVGNPMVTDTPGCDTVGFLITMILFSQHLWTLVLAIVTYCLLKHPLSRTTTLIERYSWGLYPLVWGTSALHSGLWYWQYGFSSSGNLCYYTSDDELPRDLVQFIPRALVFVVILALYSRLFHFLRRPDTIHVSSLDSSNGLGEMGERRGSVLHRLARKVVGEGKERKDDRPPWEQMEFVQVGNRRMDESVFLESDEQTRTQLGFQPTISTGIILPASGSTPFESREALVTLAPPALSPRRPSLGGRASSSHSGATLAADRQRGSDAETLVTPITRPAADDVRIERSHSSSRHILLPVLQSGKEELASPAASRRSSSDVDEGREGQSGEKGDQTMAEFFRDYQFATDLGGAERGAATAAAAHIGTPAVPHQMSAATYFNRQASLLMLYFPLAYLLVFSVSLIRLIYDMTTVGPPNPILALVSAWFVLSVGIIDGLVYGLAEFVVKRKVRRQMPDRI